MEYIRNPKLRGASNRLRVYEFFMSNPCHTNAAAAKELDLSEPTVGKHAQAIRDGWRPNVETNHEEALRLIVRAISYPVCTSIKPCGFDLRRGTDDLVTVVHAIASASLLIRKRLEAGQ